MSVRSASISTGHEKWQPPIGSSFESFMGQYLGKTSGFLFAILKWMSKFLELNELVFF